MKQVANHFYILLIGALYACQPIHEPGNLVPPTVVEDPNLGRDEVTVEGISRLIHRRIYPSDSAIESGTRQVAIVLHNEFTDTKTYHDFCMTLGRSFPVISYDPGGLGLSERIPASEWTFKAALEELKAIKEKNFRDGRVILIGHGFGGALAANYAFEYPENVQSLVLLEPYPLTSEQKNSFDLPGHQIGFFDKAWSEISLAEDNIANNNSNTLDYHALLLLNDEWSNDYYCGQSIIENPPLHRIGALAEKQRSFFLDLPFDFTAGANRINNSIKTVIVAGDCSPIDSNLVDNQFRGYFPRAEIIRFNKGINEALYNPVNARGLAIEVVNALN